MTAPSSSSAAAPQSLSASFLIRAHAPMHRLPQLLLRQNVAAPSLFPQSPFPPHFHLPLHFDSSPLPKPQHSYIGLIAMAILSAPEQKMVLSEIYQWIIDQYPYFQRRGPGWRNSIRHNLSLNDCFVKAGRCANGKGHYWAIHPANLNDFKKGDFRRRRAQKKVRRHMGLAVEEVDSDSEHQATVTQQPVNAAAVRRAFDVESLLKPDGLLLPFPPFFGFAPPSIFPDKSQS